MKTHIINAWGACKKTVKQYIQVQLAAIAITFALTAPVVIGAAGLALDMAQAYLIRERLSHALDAAALAASSLAIDDPEFQKKLERFFFMNYPDERVGEPFSLGGNNPEGSDDLKVYAYATYYPTFLKLLGIENMQIYSETYVQTARGVEVALVLDVTGSMEGSKIQSLRSASKSFIEILFDRVIDDNFVKIGMVPYSIAVNVGDIAPDIAREPEGPGNSTVNYNPDNGKKWAGCVFAKNSPNDQNDNGMDGGLWDAYWWPSDKNNPWDTQGLNLMYPPSSDTEDCRNRRSPNLGCPVQNPIVPLTSDKETLIAAANNLTRWCRGGTAGNIGMTWGWRVLSPQEPFTEGAAYNNTMWRKAVVMMTDGENQANTCDYTSYGLEYCNERDSYKADANRKFKETCQAMKQHGIRVYTVIFGSNIIGTPTEKIYEDCASDPDKFFPAGNDEELIKAFETISKNLSNLYIKG